MKLDEAIAHAREVAKEQKSKYDKCPTRTRYNCAMCFHNPKCDEDAKEHEQLAEWLELLKWYEQGMEDIPSESGVLPKDVYHAGYNKGIDDFVNACKEDILCQTFGLHANGIERIAEQLKAGGKNETN